VGATPVAAKTRRVGEGLTPYHRLMADYMRRVGSLGLDEGQVADGRFSVRIGTGVGGLAGAKTRAAREPRKGGENGNNSGTAVITRTKTQTKKPSMYRVLLLNDDYTPMEFVTHVLMRFFNKDADEATRIMMHVHHHGVGECGVFTYEVAETKVTMVMDFARKHQHPLQCIMEKK
jgi:ATP-dependent Clp protease adaptor protein ClpS